MYRNQGTSYTYHIPSPGENVLRLIFVFSAAFLLELIARILYPYNLPFLLLRFGPGFHPIQIITHIFTLAPLPFFSAILHLFFDFMILWFFGSELERNWGSHNFLKLFYVGIAGGILAAFFISPFYRFFMFGFQGGIAALLIAYATMWPDRQVILFFLFPIRMKWMIPILLLFLMASGSPGEIFTYSGGSLAGALFIYYYLKKGRISTGNVSGGFFSGIPARFQEARRKRRLLKKKKDIDRRIAMKERVDAILEKISREGMDSLTREERKFLDSASKEFGRDESN